MSGKRLAQGAVITGVVTLLAILLAEHACADDVDVVTPLAIYGGGRGADYLSTRYGISIGLREEHPVTAAVGPAPALLLATAGLTGIDVALQQRGHRGWAKALRITATAISLTVATRNIGTPMKIASSQPAVPARPARRASARPLAVPRAEGERGNVEEAPTNGALKGVRMATQALVKIEVLLPDRPVGDIKEATRILIEIHKQDLAFVLTPLTVIDHIKPFHELSLRMVRIDPSVQEEQRNGRTFYKAGPHCYFNPAFMSKGEVGLSKKGLLAILAAAGAQPVTVRIDKGTDPHYAEFQAVVYHQDFDGLYRQYPGTKVVDLRDGSPAASAMKSADQLAMARQFILENCETKAILRALRGLFGLGQVYKAEDLKRKPFVVPKLVKHWDLNDPDQKRAAIAEAMGHESKLYGGQPVMPVAPPVAELPAGGNGGEAPRALPPGQTVTAPPADETATFDDDLPDFDKPTLVVCTCPCGCQTEITPQVAELTKAALKGVSRCAKCYPGKQFEYPKHKDLKGLGIPRWPNLTAEDVREKWAGAKS